MWGAYFFGFFSKKYSAICLFFKSHTTSGKINLGLLTETLDSVWSLDV